MGTLEQILEEAGYDRNGERVRGREFISVQRVTLPGSLTHAKV
jgi:hypothetical protein